MSCGICSELLSRFEPILSGVFSLSNKDVLVIGAGVIAERKIATLLRAGANVTVVAADVRPRVRRLAAKIRPRTRSLPAKSGSGNRLKVAARPFKTGDLSKRDLVICATDDEMLNRKVGAECVRRKIWVNVVDRPAACSFVVPSVVRRGEVSFAISTGGASPALAKFLRKKIEAAFGGETAALARILKKFRKPILSLPLPARKRFLSRILNDRVLNGLKKSRAFERRLERRIKDEVN